MAAAWGFLIVLGVAFFVVLIWSAHERQRKFRDGVVALARELGGTVERARWEEATRIGFRLEGRPAEVVFHAGGEDAYPITSVRVDMRGRSRGALKIYPEGFGDAFAKMGGAQDVQVGDRMFDALYVVKSTPESLARELFDAERRAPLIAAIRKLGRYAAAAVDLSREALTVRVEEWLDDPDRVRDLVATAREFVRQIGGAEPAVEVLWVGDASGEGRCQVCGTAMNEGVVSCARCRTPHHEECWRYNGACSTFACREREYTRVEA